MTSTLSFDAAAVLSLPHIRGNDAADVAADVERMSRAVATFTRIVAAAGQGGGGDKEMERRKDVGCALIHLVNRCRSGSSPEMRVEQARALYTTTGLHELSQLYLNLGQFFDLSILCLLFFSWTM